MFDMCLLNCVWLVDRIVFLNGGMMYGVKGYVGFLYI